MTAKSLGEQIKERRKQLGITVDNLAEQIGKDRSTVYRYENGEISNITVSAMSKIADALQFHFTIAFIPDQEKKPGLLAQDRADGNKHDIKVSQKTDSVKANWLEDFRAHHPGLKNAEIIEAIRLSFPGFDKTLLSKCMSPEKYGVELSESVKAYLTNAFEGREK